MSVELIATLAMGATLAALILAYWTKRVVTSALCAPKSGRNSKACVRTFEPTFRAFARESVPTSKASGRKSAQTSKTSESKPDPTVRASEREFVLTLPMSAVIWPTCAGTCEG